LGFFWCLRPGKSPPLPASGAYIAGAEVLWRISKAQVSLGVRKILDFPDFSFGDCALREDEAYGYSRRFFSFADSLGSAYLHWARSG
jgi:hypothetical protein